MSTVNAQQVIETQQQDWNRVAPGWEKWDLQLDGNLAFLNHRLVGDARLRAGQRVLDLGSGTGYPALLAAQVVGSQGSVIGIDLAEGMLATARRKAKVLGLNNIAFQTGDVTTLPFDAASFDAVISRFCLMFPPDVPKAVGEIARVLKPGGYFAAAVWSAPDKNPYLRIPIDVVKQFIELPPPEPDQPGIFRLAKPGDLFGIVQKARLQALTDDEMTGDSSFASADEYWGCLRDIAASLQNLIAKLSPSQRTEAEAKIKQATVQFQTHGQVLLPMAIRIVVARKPY
jgi:ubiquinone/menaquinone biosynthesis C-methylase UbiE